MDYLGYYQNSQEPFFQSIFVISPICCVPFAICMKYFFRPQDQESQVIEHLKRPCVISATLSALYGKGHVAVFSCCHFVLVS